MLLASGDFISKRKKGRMDTGGYLAFSSTVSFINLGRISGIIFFTIAHSLFSLTFFFLEIQLNICVTSVYLFVSLCCIVDNFFTSNSSSQILCSAMFIMLFNP